MDDELQERALRSVTTLRGTGTAFRSIGVLALVVGLVLALNAWASSASGIGVGAAILLGIAAAVGSFTVGALFDGLAVMIELLALRQ